MPSEQRQNRRDILRFYDVMGLLKMVLVGQAKLLFSDASVCKVDWRGFVSRMAAELDIPMVVKSCDSKYKSCVSEDLRNLHKQWCVALPLDGSVVQVVERVDK